MQYLLYNNHCGYYKLNGVYMILGLVVVFTVIFGAEYVSYWNDYEVENYLSLE